MSIYFKCYNGHPMAAPEQQAGKKVPCPVCQLQVLVPRPRGFAHERVGAAAPRERGADETVPALPEVAPAAATSEPLPEKREKSALGEAKVDQGLRLYQVKLVIDMVLVVLSFVLTMMAIHFRFRQARPGVPESTTGFTDALGFWLQVGIMGVVLIQTVVNFGATILCLWVPSEAGAKRFVIVSLVLDVLALAVGFLPAVIPMQPQGPGLLPPLLSPLGLGAVVVLIRMVSWVFWMLFLRELAGYIDARDWSYQAQALIIPGIAWVVVPTLLLVLFAMIGKALLFNGLIVAWAFGAFYVLNKILQLVGGLRELLGRAAEAA